MVRKFARAASLLGALTLSACGIEPSVQALPVADAGFDEIVKVNGAVTLDGSKSSGAGARWLAFAWELVAKPQGSTATLAGADTAAPSFTADLEGTYLVELVVAAGGGRSRPDMVAISARNRPPTALALCIPAGCSVLHGRNAQLDARQSNDADGGSVVVSATWTQVLSCDECPALPSCNPNTTPVTVTPTTVAGVAGFAAPQLADVSLVFRLTVSDGVDTGTTCIAVKLTNTPPQALLSPTNPVSVTQGGLFHLSALGSGDSDPGEVVTYAWTQTAGAPAIIPTPSAKETDITAPNTLGAITFAFTISDGVAQDTKSVSLTVN